MTVQNLDGDTLTAEQLVQDVLGYFQKEPKVLPKKQKKIKKAPQELEDDAISTEMIEELKALREQQKTSSRQSYIGIAKPPKN